MARHISVAIKTEPYRQALRVVNNEGINVVCGEMGVAAEERGFGKLDKYCA